MEQQDEDLPLGYHSFDLGFQLLFQNVATEISDLALSQLIGEPKRKIISAVSIPIQLDVVTQLETDYLVQLTFDDGSEWLLHIEVQTRNDSKMAKRMLFYAGGIHLQHLQDHQKLYQITFYIGKERMNMPVQVEISGEPLNFKMVDFRQFSADYFLSYDSPHMYMLAVFSGTADLKAVIAEIMDRIWVTELDFKEKKTLIDTLEVFSVLRGARQIVINLKEEKKMLVDISDDFLYLRGKNEGIMQGKQEGKQEGKLEGKFEIALQLLSDGMPLEVVIGKYLTSDLERNLFLAYLETLNNYSD